MAAPSTGYTSAATGHLDSSGYGTGYAGPEQPAAPDSSWYPADNGTGNGAAASYYDTSYTAPGHGDGAAASEAGYSGNGYTGADYYDSSYEAATAIARIRAAIRLPRSRPPAT